jgi:cbb3-type cytochrome oxidase subunit 3
MNMSGEGLPKRSKLGLLLASLAVLAIVAWALLPDEQESFDKEQQFAEVEDERTVVSATDPGQALRVVETEAEAQAQRVNERQSMPARRGEFDAFAMPFPFSGRCVANGRAVAGATVHYKDETRTTEKDGHFSFPNYGYVLRVMVEADGFGQLITQSSESNMTIRMQPPTTGRVVVFQGDSVVEGAKVWIYLLPEIVKMTSSERFFLSDLPVVGQQRTDAQGIARFSDLPCFDRLGDARLLLYCLVEYPDGVQREAVLGHPHDVKNSGGAPRKEWRLSCRRDGAPTPDLRIEQRNELGTRVPVPNQLVYFRVNQGFYTPWHQETTDSNGLIEVKEWDASRLQVLVPLSKRMSWSSISEPLIDLGSVLVALLETEEQSVRLLPASEDNGLRFQIQRVASAKEDGDRAPRAGKGLGSLSDWGWQDCIPGESVKLVSGWAGKNSWAWVRVQPGNRVIASKRLIAKGHTDIQLPELARLTVLTGEGQRFPLGARVWLSDQSSTHLPPILLDPRGSNLVQGTVPFGVYHVSVVTTGVHQMRLGNLQVDSAKQEHVIELPQNEATLALSLGPHFLSSFEVRVDRQSTLRRSDANGELVMQGATGDSYFVQLPASPKLSELEFPGRPDLIFLGYEAYVVFSNQGMSLPIPLGSLFVEEHADDGGRVRITRHDSAGGSLASVELDLPGDGAMLARTLPAGHYRLETNCRTIDVEIKPIGRVQVDADDR